MLRESFFNNQREFSVLCTMRCVKMWVDLKVTWSKLQLMQKCVLFLILNQIKLNFQEHKRLSWLKKIVNVDYHKIDYHKSQKSQLLFLKCNILIKSFQMENAFSNTRWLKVLLFKYPGRKSREIPRVAV